MNLWTLKVRIHQSWLIALAATGIVVGVVSSPYVPVGSFSSLAWVFAAIIMLAFGFWRGRRYVIPVVFIGGALIGLWRSDITLLQLAPYEKLIGNHVMVIGKVTEDADVGTHGESILRLNVVQIDGRAMSGNVWLSSAMDMEIKRGDIVTVEGKLADGFGSFVASMYRASVKTVQRPEPGDVGRQVRDGFAGAVRSAVPEPQASLGNGFLLGQRRALPPELSEALQIAGLAHVIVASGYNLTILVRIARRIFVKVSKYLATLSAGGMIAGFIAITGMGPSMSRAGLVAGLSLLAWYYGRKFHPLVLLPFAAAVTLLINPSFGWNDLGWQLSFAAFAGVMIIAPLAQRYLFGENKPGLFRQILGETICAQIATLPILVLAFGQFSNVAIIANLLVLPLVPLAMLLTFITGILAIVLPAFVGLIGVPVTLLLEYMTNVANYLAGVSWAQSDIEIGWHAVVAAYVTLALICLYMSFKTKYNLRDSNIVE